MVARKLYVHDAVAAGDERAVTDLLRMDFADLNQLDADGLSPLHLAVKQGYLSIAGQLLRAGASANAPSRSGYTPLYFVVVAPPSCQVAMASLLVTFGARETIRMRQDRPSPRDFFEAVAEPQLRAWVLRDSIER